MPSSCGPMLPVSRQQDAWCWESRGILDRVPGGYQDSSSIGQSGNRATDRRCIGLRLLLEWYVMQESCVLVVCHIVYLRFWGVCLLHTSSRRLLLAWYAMQQSCVFQSRPHRVLPKAIKQFGLYVSVIGEIYLNK